jgi:hypothetical protein
MRKLAFGLVLAAVAGAVPRGAQAQNVVTCESHGGRRQTCSVDTRGGDVRLVRRLSDTPCVQGRSWGTTSRGVWVDDGCRAQFSVSRGRGGSYGGGGRDGGSSNGRYGNGGYGNGGYGRANGDGRDGRVDGSRAIGLCRQAVRRQVGNRRRVELWLQGQDRNNARVGWRSDRGMDGTCRVDRNGRVDVRVDRRR